MTAQAEPSPAVAGPALVGSDIGAGYGAHLVVENVNLTLTGGETRAVIGPNGSGKSTLLKALAGLLPLAAGTVTLNGEDVTRRSTEDRVAMGLGYVPQVSDVFSPLTVSENLAAGGYLLPKRTVRDRANEVLEMFPLLGNLRSRIAGRLSGGERKLLAIGRVLMLRPAVLLLDEPTANLAPIMATELLTEHIGRLATSGCAVLLVEQRASEALAIADWGYVLVNGHVQIDGSGQALLAREDVGELFLGQSVGQRSET